jgi:hypothetical protein
VIVDVKIFVHRFVHLDHVLAVHTGNMRSGSLRVKDYSECQRLLINVLDLRQSRPESFPGLLILAIAGRLLQYFQ